MSRLGSTLTGVVLGGALVYGALNYHVLRTAEGVELVPKLSATFSDTYLDVRQYGVAEWADHEQVARAVVKSGKDHILKDAATRSVQEGINSLWDRVRS
jgi:hypothetical protein